MTTHKTFKRRVRARMTKTGESYTAARRVVVARGERPEPAEPAAAPFQPPLPDETVAKATGHGWEHWFRLLDGWGATQHTHTEIAAWLSAEHGVASWWRQSITVGYEQARGMRAPGQHADGFAVSATKTIGVPVERLFAAVHDDSLREGWLPGAQMRLRTATAPRTARFDWEDGSSRLAIGFTRVGPDRSTVALSHERLPDADAAAHMKAWWRERLGVLKQMLEGTATTGSTVPPRSSGTG